MPSSRPTDGAGDHAVVFTNARVIDPSRSLDAAGDVVARADRRRIDSLRVTVPAKFERVAGAE